MPPRNLDPQTRLCWFRKVSRHTQREAESVAAAFCIRVATKLLAPPMVPPRIYWFEESDYSQAKSAWLAQPRHNSSAADPLREDCEYFRWPGPGRFWGYTHLEAPLGIMINVCRSGYDLLDTVAHESFHVYQDLMHGSGWRERTDEEVVEREANDFVRSIDSELRQFTDGAPCR
jgi:hypothetical protein